VTDVAMHHAIRRGVGYAREVFQVARVRQGIEVYDRLGRVHSDPAADEFRANESSTSGHEYGHWRFLSFLTFSIYQWPINRGRPSARRDDCHRDQSRPQGPLA